MSPVLAASSHLLRDVQERHGILRSRKCRGTQRRTCVSRSMGEAGRVLAVRTRSMEARWRRSRSSRGSALRWGAGLTTGCSPKSTCDISVDQPCQDALRRPPLDTSELHTAGFNRAAFWMLVDNSCRGMLSLVQ